MLRSGMIVGLTAIGLLLLLTAAISLWTPLRWWRSVPSEHGIRIEVSKGTMEASSWQFVREAKQPGATKRTAWGFGHESFTASNLVSFDWREKVSMEMRFSLATLLGPSGSSVVAKSYFVPLWPCALILLTYPVAAFVRGPLRRRRRRMQNRCVGCGYDLTGLPEARCPECGRTVHAE